MEKRKTLDFGKKYRIGNFFVFKYNKVLRKSEIAELRDQMGIPMDERRKLQRAQLPFMKVEAISGIWSVEFCCNTTIYQFVDQMLCKAIIAEEENIVMESNTVASFAHIFNHMYMDTCILGDSIYHQDKGNALKAFMERQKAVTETPEQKAADDKILDELKVDEEAKATIVDMAKTIKEGGDNE